MTYFPVAGNFLLFWGKSCEIIPFLTSGDKNLWWKSYLESGCTFIYQHPNLQLFYDFVVRWCFQILVYFHLPKKNWGGRSTFFLKWPSKNHQHKGIVARSLGTSVQPWLTQLANGSGFLVNTDPNCILNPNSTQPTHPQKKSGTNLLRLSSPYFFCVKFPAQHTTFPPYRGTQVAPLVWWKVLMVPYARNLENFNDVWPKSKSWTRRSRWCGRWQAMLGIRWWSCFFSENGNRPFLKKDLWFFVVTGKWLFNKGDGEGMHFSVDEWWMDHELSNISLVFSRKPWTWNVLSWPPRLRIVFLSATWRNLILSWIPQTCGWVAKKWESQMWLFVCKIHHDNRDVTRFTYWKRWIFPLLSCFTLKRLGRNQDDKINFLEFRGAVLKGTAPNVSHWLTQSDAHQRGAHFKDTVPNLSHRPTQSNARQRGAVSKGTDTNVSHRLTERDVHQRDTPRKVTFVNVCHRLRYRKTGVVMRVVSSL